MVEEVSIDVRLSEKTDGGDDEVQGRVSVRASDQSGSPLEASITVSADQASYEEQKTGSAYGSTTTFENVPMPATVLIEETGYESMSISIDENDIGTSIARGY